MKGKDESKHVKSGGSSSTRAQKGLGSHGVARPKQSHDGARSGATSRMPEGAFEPVRPASAAHASKHAAKASASDGASFAPAAFGTASSQVVPKRRKRIPLILASVALVLLAAIYAAGAVYFSNHFYPSTTMGALDLSMKTIDEAVDALTRAEEGYQLKVTGQGLNFTVSAQEGGIAVDAQKVMESAHDDVQYLLWPLRIFGIHDAASHLAATSDSGTLGTTVNAAVSAFNEEAAPSVDAAVAFDEKSGVFKVVNEVYGKQVSEQAVLEAVANAVATLETSLVLEDNVVIKPEVLATDPRLSAGCDAANAMIQCDVTLKASVDGKTITEIDSHVISGWISFDADFMPVFDDEALNAWADELAASLNTVGTSRTYTRPDGKQVTVSGGDYGWSVDSEALITSVKNAITSGMVGEIEIPSSRSGNGYTKPGQDWGAYCDVDLTEQHAYYYDASGTLLWESGVITGKPDAENATPTGVFYLKNLQTNVNLKGPIDPETKKPKWDSPVSYWMPFVGNLIGLHDANWQAASSFSNPDAYRSVGSHGCVNLPTDKAAEIYGIIQIGDPVIVHT